MDTRVVDTGIDEFFDERLKRVLGAPPATAEEGSWYPGSPDGPERRPVMPEQDKPP
jgi:hypothetical protein